MFNISSLKLLNAVSYINLILPAYLGVPNKYKLTLKLIKTKWMFTRSQVTHLGLR